MRVCFVSICFRIKHTLCARARDGVCDEARRNDPVPAAWSSPLLLFLIGNFANAEFPRHEYIRHPSLVLLLHQTYDTDLREFMGAGLAEPNMKKQNIIMLK